MRLKRARTGETRLRNLVVIVAVLIFTLSSYSVAADNPKPKPKREPSYPTESKTNFAATAYAWADHYTLIAHALGGISGKTASNSLEAFQENYKRGHRVFETDILFSTDGELVLRHDWQPYMYNFLEQPVSAKQMQSALSVKDFKALKIYKKYTPLTFAEMVKIMQSHPDMYLMTDTKEIDSPSIQKKFKAIVNEVSKVDKTILDRIIPQIYDEQMLHTIQAVYDFKNIAYTLYLNNQPNADVVDFSSKNGIKVIVLNELRYSKSFVTQLAAKGIYTYVHTINDVKKIDEYEQSGVRGVMTDNVIPKTVAEYKAKKEGGQH